MAKVIDHTDTDSDEENDMFFFESDHLALIGNADYTTLLRSLAILEAQKVQVIKNIEEVVALKEKALAEPLTFLKKLADNEVKFPPEIKPLEVPNIDFDKYNVKFPEVHNAYENEDNSTVKGRNFDDTKPETFNQPWTCEEQRRLEQLLIEYPPEPIEMRRFAKIAKALGNRTTKQVASRLQKYFKKLHAAGMPIPGRIPKSRMRGVSVNSKFKYRPSTFFPNQMVPVQMPEDETLLGPNWNLSSSNSISKPSSSANSIASNENDNEKYSTDSCYIVDDDDCDNDNQNQDEKTLLVNLLKRVQLDKKKETIDGERSKHYNFMCNLCKEEPIIGTRWNCRTCIKESVNFCSDCLVTQALSFDTRHPLTHKFVGIKTTESLKNTLKSDLNTFNQNDSDEEYPENEEKTKMQNVKKSNKFIDKDYLVQKFSKSSGECNYLDPNFLLE